ncbi:hypothetical protein Taro_049406 [Colocasia esculenta]|uniref:Uncharacterized protein n=1 Tax=Colocasia esculenta TaxID=4460 RepID=A0A843XAT6_COLES|nr:hypothetical protein [Colocasia esculenta]
MTKGDEKAEQNVGGGKREREMTPSVACWKRKGIQGLHKGKICKENNGQISGQPSKQKGKRTAEGERIGDEDDGMPAYPRRDVRRPPSTATWVAASALWLLSLAALPSRSGAVRPSDHGLAFQKNASGPAMVSFFRGAGGGEALPQAGNATAGTVWDVPSQSSPSDGDAAEADMVDGRDRARTVLLTAGVVCGAVGVALLAAAALAYLVQARRRRDECGSGGNG